MIFERCKVMVEELESILQACLNLKGNALRSYVRLVGGFNPTEKNISQVGSIPQVGLNKKKTSETTT